MIALVYYHGPIGTPATTPNAYWSIGGRSIAKLDTLYLSTVTRAGGLLLGSAFALVWRPYAVMRGPLRSKGRILFDVGAILSVAALAWMVWSIHLVTIVGASASLFRGGLFLVGLAMLVLIAAVTHGGTYSRRLLGIRPLVWVGLRSYGLYLYPLADLHDHPRGGRQPDVGAAVRDRDGRHRLSSPSCRSAGSSDRSG